MAKVLSQLSSFPRKMTPIHVPPAQYSDEFLEYSYSREEWFWEKKMLHILQYVVPNCCRTPITKFHVFMLPLSLVAGPQQIWTATLKSATTKLLKTFLKPATGGNVFFDLKNEEKKYIYFDLVQIKNSFAHFWKIKTNLNTFFQTFFLLNVFWCKRKVFANFQKNIKF